MSENKPMTITEFLEARIAEDEADLQRWSSNAPGWTRRDHAFGGSYDQVTMGYGRALAECATKRAIVETLRTSTLSLHGQSVLRALAAIYASHPDYRQDWGL